MERDELGDTRSPVRGLGELELGCCAVENSGKMIHYDGSDWLEVNSGVGYGLNDIWGSNASSIFIAAEISPDNSGTVLKGDGMTWQPVSEAALRYATDARFVYRPLALRR